MPESLNEFFSLAKQHVVLFDAWVETFSPPAKADHICFKCSSSEEFEQIRELFEDSSEYIYQSIISQRRVVILRFLQPLPTKLGDIWLLELSDQKPDRSQLSGFDHVEIYPDGVTVDQLVDDLTAKGVVLEKIVRPHCTTFDGFIMGNLKIRIEPGPQIDKIKTSEML